MNKKSQQTVLLAVGIFYLDFALIVYWFFALVVYCFFTLIVYWFFALIVYWGFALFICANSVRGKFIPHAADGSGLYAHISRAVC